MRNHPRSLDLVKAMQELATYTHWNEDIMQQACVNIGLDQSYHRIIFPDGVGEAILCNELFLDHKMLNILNNRERPEKIRQKISLALAVRVIELGVKEDGLKLMPKTSPKAMWNTSDAIWKYVGDKSLDFNYYSKRTILLAVYVKVRKFYQQDNSNEFSATSAYIDEQIRKVLEMGKIKEKFKLENIPILRLFS